MPHAATATDDLNTASEQGEADFLRDGVLGPIRLFTEAQCQIIAERLRREDRRAPPEWKKGRAVCDRFWYELATHPSLRSLLRSLLGDDVILWGASTVERRPGQTHSWHTDMETCAPDGRFVSVWVGIENTSQESALHVITRSHLSGQTVQQTLQEKGLRRSKVSAQEVLALARESDPAAELRQPSMTNGEMLLFDGRLWHGSNNARREGKRLALLLQYAAADVPVRIPDFKQVEWPFRYFDSPRPPVIVVSGTPAEGANRVAPPPPLNPEELLLLSSGVHPVPLPLADNPKKHWKSQRILRGCSTVLDFFNCHITTLKPGHSPHPPHAHPEEELEIVLDGEAEVVVSDSPAEEGARIETVRPGTFVYYPPFQHHTIRNAGTVPVTYLMFKWRRSAAQAGEALATGLYHYGGLSPDAAKGYWTQRLIRDPTPYLTRLGCHLTVLQPGKGYPPHGDAYDVAILLLSGAVETLGETVTAPSVIYYAAGEPHGMRNVGERPARYLVFEFHAEPRQAAPVPEEKSRDLPAPDMGKPAKRKPVRKASQPRNPAGPARQLAAWMKGALGRNRPSDALPESVGLVLRQARERRCAGDLEGALAVYRTAPSSIRKDPRIKAKRKKIMEQLRRKEKQMRDAAAHLRELGRAGSVARAVAIYESAPPAFREGIPSLYAYACLLKKSRRFTDAYDAFRGVLKSNPSHRKAWIGAGSTLVRLGLRDELSRLIDEMLAALPPTSDVLMRASSMARNGDLHALAIRLCDRALSAAAAEGPSATVEAARVLLGRGEQGRVIGLLDREDIRSDARLEGEARDLKGLALAQLRMAGGRACEPGPVEEGERADVIAVEDILQHASEARATYRPVQGGMAIVLGSLGPGGIQTQVVQLIRRLRKARERQVGPIALLIANLPKLDPEFHKGALAELDVTIEAIVDFDVRLADVVPADVAGRIGVLPRPVLPRVAFLIDRLRTHRPEVVLAMADVVGVPVMLTASIVGVPRVVVSVRGEPPSIGGARDSLFRPAYQAALARNAIVLSANSRATAENFAEWLGQSPDSVRTIYNGVDVDRLLSARDPSATAAHRRSLNIPDGARVVGSVFNYRREKRPELWIEAAGVIAKRTPDVVFVHVGGASMFNDFTPMLRRLGLQDRFHMLGTRKDVATWVDLMDVFLLTSSREGTPNVLLEAQALGRPVVATAVGGNAETFLPDETGILLSADPTPEEVADAVLKVLSDPGFAARAAEHAPGFIRRRFGVDRMASEFVEICFDPDARPDASGSRPWV